MLFTLNNIGFSYIIVFVDFRKKVCLLSHMFIINLWLITLSHRFGLVHEEMVHIFHTGQNPYRPKSHLWAQVEWRLEHRHGWLVKHQRAESVLGKVTRDEHQMLGSTSIPVRLELMVYWESFSWLTSVGTTRNTVIRHGWSKIGLAVPILHAAGAGLIGRPAVTSGRYNECDSLQLQNHNAHFPPL